MISYGNGNNIIMNQEFSMEALNDNIQAYNAVNDPDISFDTALSAVYNSDIAQCMGEYVTFAGEQRL